MKKVITLILDQAQLKDAITKHGKKRGLIDQETHVLACSAVKAFADHGNVFYINQLYASMGKGARHAALTAWYLNFAGVMANDGEGKDVTPFIKDANKKVDLEEGIANPWFDFKPSPAPDAVVDMLKVLMAAIKKGKVKDGQTMAHSEVLAKMKAIAAEYETAEETNSGAADDSEAPV
jgi:hypothetical protein